MLNWAWIVESNELGHWEQFDCVTCMALESKYQLWKNDKSVKFKLSIGTVKFGTMTVEKNVRKTERIKSRK